MELDKDCVFCKIITGEEPAEIVHRTKSSITIVPLNPVTQGHLLVIPLQHAQYIWELDIIILGWTMDDIASLAFNYAHQSGFLATNIIQSNGKDATQTINHVHFHVVPRRNRDGLRLPWTGQKSLT